MSLENYGVKTGLIPNGGAWYYNQSFKGEVIRIEAPDGDALVEAVKVFRARGGLDIGEVAGDVAAFIKQISPPNNKFPGKDYPVSEVVQPSSHRPLIERLKDWILVIAPKRPVLLIEPDADERAEICAQCRHNVKWKVGCAPCNEEVEYRGKTLRQRALYKNDGVLNACRLHNVLLNAAVFIDSASLPTRHPNAPSNCWIPT